MRSGGSRARVATLAPTTIDSCNQESAKNEEKIMASITAWHALHTGGLLVPVGKASVVGSEFLQGDHQVHIHSHGLGGGGGRSRFLLPAANALVSLRYPRGREGREGRVGSTGQALTVILRQTAGLERTQTALVVTGGERCTLAPLLGSSYRAQCT